MPETLIVQTNSGPVRGRLECGTNNSDYYCFRGIPYAKPPVGVLRFKAPQRPDAWTDIRDATEPGSIAYQNNLRHVLEFPPLDNPQSEDCLFVNVYMKAPSSSDRSTLLPVMVMLHPGGYSCGSGGDELKPDFLLEHDVLYITLNYRLGVFGFLSIADPTFDIPGNAGLKDQALAMRWAQENCAHFGGDAGNITVMGFSAGGASVHYHLISDHSEGLFQRAIVQSGSALCPWASQPPQRNVNERLARALGWTGDGGDAAMWRTIVDAPAQEIATQQHAMVASTDDFERGLVCLFVPTVEPYDNGTVFVDRPVAEMNASAWGHRVPLLVGGVSGEGYLVYGDIMLRHDRMFGRGFENLLPRDIKTDLLPDGEEETTRIRLGDALRRVYYADDETPSKANDQPYFDLMTDKLFWHPIYRIVRARLANPAGNSAPTYLYHFDYSSEKLSAFQTVFYGKHNPERVTHCDDSVFLYRIPAMHDDLPDDCWEVRLRQIYTSVFTSFATSGQPTHVDVDELNWQPVCGQAAGPFKCLNIARELSVIDLPHTKRLQFWDSLYEGGDDDCHEKA